MQLSFGDPSPEIVEYIRVVRLFLEDVNNDLNIISQRIDRVRPKLRQFISSINQRNFDRNTENFLRFLLKSSSISKDGNKKKIQLYKEIPVKVVYEPESIFIMVEEGRLFPKQPSPLILPKGDKKKREKQLNKAQDRMRINRRIRFWLNSLDLRIKKESSLDFSKAYYDILEKEERYGKTIALKVANNIFRKYTKLKNFSVKVERKMMIDNKYPEQAIWKMNIQKLQDK